MEPALNDKVKCLTLADAIDRAMECDNYSFPISVFPEPIQALIDDAERTVGHPPEYLSAGILSATATAIGNTITLDAGSWMAKPILWISIIGHSGEHKTHPLNFAKKPFEQRDSELYREYESALKEYENLAPEDRKRRPTYSKFLLKDFTPEYLVEALKYNSKGVMIFQDELMGWIHSFDQYKKGGDQQKYLELWNGGAVDVGRKGSDPIRVERTNVNILGGMQPELLKDMAKNNRSNDGFLNRFLFVYPDTTKPRLWTGDKIQEVQRDNYFRMISNLLEAQEKTIVAGTDSLDIYKQWQHQTAQEHFHDNLEKQIQAKMETYVWRLTLILEMMHQATSGEHSTALNPKSARDAILLVEYFRRNALKVNDRIGSRSPLDNLTSRQKDIYDALPDAFKREEVLPLFKVKGIGDRTGDRFLQNGRLFFNYRTLKELKQGEYKKKELKS